MAARSGAVARPRARHHQTGRRSVQHAIGSSGACQTGGHPVFGIIGKQAERYETSYNHQARYAEYESANKVRRHRRKDFVPQAARNRGLFIFSFMPSAPFPSVSLFAAELALRFAKLEELSAEIPAMFAGLDVVHTHPARRWTALASFTLQAALVGTALVLPLLKPASLPEAFARRPIFRPISAGVERPHEIQNTTSHIGPSQAPLFPIVVRTGPAVQLQNTGPSNSN